LTDSCIGIDTRRLFTTFQGLNKMNTHTPATERAALTKPIDHNDQALSACIGMAQLTH